MSAATTYLTELVTGLHPLLQFLAVFAIGLVPYLESHVGAFVGTVTGVPVVLAALAAIAGNLLALVVAVRAGGAVARRIAQRRTSGPGRRTQKVLAKVDRFGVPVASLLGPFVLATALSTFVMISAGLHRRTVIIWQAVAVTAWGVAFAVLGLGAGRTELMGRRTFTTYKRRWQLSKARPGDGSRLQPYRWWQLFSRSLFAIELDDQVFDVDVRHSRDSSSDKRPAALYRNGVQVLAGNVPVAFPVPGGVIEVATTMYGLKRMHLVDDDGHEQVLAPHPRSHEGLRARFGRRCPRTSAAIGAVGLAVLLVGLAATLSVAAEQITQVEVIAAHLGTFVSPIQLPVWAKFALPVAGALAAVDRALRLKSTWMAD